MKRLQIIDSTTITLFSNLIFKGAGRHPKTGKEYNFLEENGAFIEENGVDGGGVLYVRAVINK